MFLDFFDDVFLLDFALETLQRTFQGLTILNDNFSQRRIHLPFLSETEVYHYCVGHANHMTVLRGKC